MRRRKVGGGTNEKEIQHVLPDSLVLRLCSVPTLVPHFCLDPAICSGCLRGCDTRLRCFTRSGHMRTMCAPLSIKASVFTEIRSVGLLTQHVQIRCFPFKGGAGLTDVTLVSEDSEVLVSAMMFTACRKIVATSSGADAVACTLGSVIAATGAG